jgi:hypothetical protein
VRLRRWNVLLAVFGHAIAYTPNELETDTIFGIETTLDDFHRS